MKGVLITASIALIFLGPGVPMVVEGVDQYRAKTKGEKAEARITECRTGGFTRSRSIICTGIWVMGGELVGGDGRVSRGTVHGASRGDESKTIDIRVDGDRAYTSSLTNAIFFIAFGVLLSAIGVLILVSGLRRPASRGAGRAG